MKTKSIGEPPVLKDNKIVITEAAIIDAYLPNNLSGNRRPENKQEHHVKYSKPYKQSN